MKEYLISLAQHYGGIGVAIGLALEFLGLPVPGETMMTFLGYLTWQGVNKSFWSAVIWSVIGTNIGSIFAYFVGLKYGESVLLKFGKYIFITKEKLDKTTNLMNKNKIFLLLFSRYVPGVRHVVPYLSGISKISFGSFAIYNLVGSIIWCVSFVGLGAVLGDKWKAVESLIKGYSIILILLAVFVYVVFKYFNKHKVTIFMVSFPIMLFIKLSEDMIRQESSIFDAKIYTFLSNYNLNGLSVLASALSYIGSEQFMLVFSLIIYFALKNNKKYVLYSKALIVNLILSISLNMFFKIIFHRELPVVSKLAELSGLGYPNSHSMVGLSFYGLIIYFCFSNITDKAKRWLAAASISLMILLIGGSRILLGVNYASDVLAGFAGGLAWLAVYIILFNKSMLNKASNELV